MMDCDQVRDLLDAYALGAAEDPEAADIEQHVADCVRCWEELSKAQQTAAMLALAIPLEDAPAGLEARIMRLAERESARQPAGAGGLLHRFRVGWPATAGALAVASVAALAFAAVLQFQLADLRDDKNSLEQQVQAEQKVVNEIRDIVTLVATADDMSTTELAAVSGGTAAAGTAIYGWSRKYLSGFIVCQGLPPLEDGMTYQAWFRVGESVLDAGTFESDDGTCHLPVTFDRSVQLTGVGITAEPEGGSPAPGDWLMYADFTR